MFWEVWRNVASATTNWGLGGNANKKGLSRSSKSGKSKSCYDRLVSSSTSISSSTGCGPKKSVSQPVNLTQFTKDTSCDKECCTPSLEESASSSHISPNGTTAVNKKASSTGKSGGVKRSLSSFFPFSTCTFSGSTAKSKSSEPQYQPHNNNNEAKLITMSSGSSVDSAVVVDQEDQAQQEDRCTSQCERREDHIIDYWDDSMELPTCDVCARAFPTIKQLAAHQRKKRHYGCIECDSIFPSREILECHREQMCHYEFALDMYTVDERNLEDEDFFESDDDAMWDEDDEDCDDEEMERLL